MTMAIPLVYNLRSARHRWVSSLVAVLGIAGTVAVFVAMLALSLVSGALIARILYLMKPLRDR